jgi:hypothetical protein
VVVDCHEFDRSSSSYLDRGWTEWPLITMGTANHPLLPERVYRDGLAWVEAVAVEMARAGIDYERYLVGGPPPGHELRPSTFDGDDARNGLALAAGSLGFIIESGVTRAAEDPQTDIAGRVAAYLTLLQLFVTDLDLRQAAIATADEVRSRQPPEFIAINTFWGKFDREHRIVKVTSAATGDTIEVPSPNLMTDRVFKRWETTPAGYVIDRAVADPYRELLDRHAIGYEVLDEPARMTVEACRLDRVENETDEVYERYPGRQIVACAAPSSRNVAAGSLVVHLERGSWRTVVALIEPTMLYGLYQHDRFQDTVAEDGQIPVWRVVEP